MTTITSAQIGKLQAERRKLGMRDDDYRDWLAREAGVASTKDLTIDQAKAMIDTLVRENGSAPARPASATMAGPYASVLRALWLTAYNLGVVRNADDAALIAFCERQTKISHTRFLTAPRDATRVIEALKSWIAREAQLAWPAKDDPRGFAEGTIVDGSWGVVEFQPHRATKIAVLERQWLMLVEAGAVEHVVAHLPLLNLPLYVASLTNLPPRCVSSLADARLTLDVLDKAAVALGKKLRRALKEAA